MKFKKLLISSTVLFGAGMMATIVTLFQVYNLIGTDKPKEVAIAELDRYQVTITIGRVMILAAVILFVIWTILVLKASYDKRSK